MIRRLFTALRRFRGEDGSSTIEFCLWFPFVLGVLGSAFEASFITTRQAMLVSAVDRVVRDFQLNNLGSPTHSELRAAICNTAGVIPDCDEALKIELERVDKSTFAFREGQVQCIDRDEDLEPATAFNSTQSNDLMLMTVCAAIKPMIPVTGLGLMLPKINDGTYYGLVTYAAFVVEPV